MKNVKVENGVIVGTSGDKLTNKNPLAKLIIRNFDNKIRELLYIAQPRKVLEIGCGEGHVTEIILNETEAIVHATDISEKLVDELRNRMPDDRLSLQAISIESMSTEIEADTVVCCEVLEHIEDPELGLQKLAQFNAANYIISVPREPLFRGMNMARGAYLKDFGNSPGHIHHWSTSAFKRLVSRYFTIEQVRTPIPWTVLLCTPAGTRGD